MPKELWEMIGTDPPPPHCHFDKSGAAKSHASNDRNTALPCRHFDRSGAEWRNLTPQMAETPTRHSSFRRKRSGAAKSHSPMVCSIATGDLSTQRFNSPEVFIPIPPCPSARDDDIGWHPYRHFGRSGAEWRNLTPQWARKRVRLSPQVV